LPLPAPAITMVGPSVASTAARWAELSPCRMSMGSCEGTGDAAGSRKLGQSVCARWAEKAQGGTHPGFGVFLHGVAEPP